MNIEEIKNYWDHARKKLMPIEGSFLEATFEECLEHVKGEWDGINAFKRALRITISNLTDAKRELEDVLAWLRKHKEESGG